MKSIYLIRFIILCGIRLVFNSVKANEDNVSALVKNHTSLEENARVLGDYFEKNLLPKIKDTLEDYVSGYRVPQSLPRSQSENRELALQVQPSPQKEETSTLGYFYSNMVDQQNPAFPVIFGVGFNPLREPNETDPKAIITPTTKRPRFKNLRRLIPWFLKRKKIANPTKSSHIVADQNIYNHNLQDSLPSEPSDTKVKTKFPPNKWWSYLNPLKWLSRRNTQQEMPRTRTFYDHYNFNQVPRNLFQVIPLKRPFFNQTSEKMFLERMDNLLDII